MELSLHGSQINLATRQTITKPNNTTVKLSTRNRPSSAQVGHNTNINYRLQFNKNRPQSADTTNIQINKSLKRPSSSSNILKLLLSEPIKQRYWSDISVNNVKFGERRRISVNKKISKQMNNNEENSISGDSSVEEEIEEECPTAREDCEKSNSQENEKNNVNNSEKIITSKPPLPKKPLKLSLPLNNKTHLQRASSMERWKLSAFFDDKPKDKIDLPGRVSFSTGAVYTTDYNDYVVDDAAVEYDDQQNHNLYKKSVHFSEEKNQSIYGSSSSTAYSTPNPVIENYNKISGIASTSIPAITLTSSNDLSGSDQIIEDYKREIENLNRKHEADMKESQSLNENLLTTINAGSSSLPNYLSNDLQKTDVNIEIDDKSLEAISPEKPKDVIKDFYEAVDNIPSPPVSPKSSRYLNEPSSQWNNSTTAIPIKYPETTSEIIKNYLSVQTNDFVLENVKSKVENAKSNKFTPIVKKKKTASSSTQTKDLRKIKSATSNQKQLKQSSNNLNAGSSTLMLENKNLVMKKSKSISCLRDKKNFFDEFNLDKIESWMSMHDDETMSEKDEIHSNHHHLNHHHHHHNHHNHHHSNSNSNSSNGWRETPTSKTDDEGNFSLEDQIDTNSSTESTYDEIVEIIKEIDSDKRKSDSYNNVKENVEFKLRALLMNSDSPTTTTDSALSEEIDSTGDHDKMKEILTYLDDIDAKCDKTLEDVKKFVPPNSDRSEMEFTIEADIIEDVPKISDLIMFPNHQLARRIVTLSLRANELSNAILLSKEHVAHVRSEKQKAIRIEKQKVQNQLKEQKKHYESIVQRHQGFIEQLLKDKSGLCDKITNMTRRFDSQNQAWEHKLSTEVQRAKETAVAGEKIRREKWVRENTKKIKELTVKGLEDEINRMTTNHQKEITDLKYKHQQELLEAVDEVRQKYEQTENHLRDTFARDREGYIEKERNAIRERFEKQMEMEHKSFEQQKQKLLKENIGEKERLFIELKEKEEIFDNLKENLMKDRNEMLEQLKYEFNEKIKSKENKHQAELKSLQEQFEHDFAIWKREHEAIYKRREVEREDAIRSQCRMERDRQIDSIVAKVDIETTKNQKDFEIKMIRIKEKYETEIKELEQSEQMSRDRFNETRNKLAESEASIQNQQATIKQMEIELNHTKRMCDEFIEEKKNFKENAKKEIKLEIITVQKERDNEIERIYARVQQAMEKKDSTLELLQKENTSLKERCIKLEAVIRQQRKDYCIK